MKMKMLLFSIYVESAGFRVRITKYQGKFAIKNAETGRTELYKSNFKGLVDFARAEITVIPLIYFNSIFLSPRIVSEKMHFDASKTSKLVLRLFF